MKFSFVLFLLGAFYIATGVFFSRVSFESALPLEPFTTDREFYDYSGVLNVHSKKSNGSGSVQDIITSAAAADLDFIIFNEKNPIDQQQPPPIKYGNLNVIYGSELNYRNSRVLHFLGEKSPVFTSHSEVQIYISNFLETGGDGVMALSHPNKPGYEWSQSTAPDFLTGIEVLNLREVWRKAWEKKKLSFLSGVVFYPFNSNLFFLDIFSDEALSTTIWDEWSQRKPLSGYVGSDATSKLRISKRFSLNFPSYKSIFKMAQNHVLLREELVGIGDHKILVEALKNGNSYFSIDIFGDPSGFVFFASSTNNKSILMGEQIQLDSLKSLNVSLPRIEDDLEIDLYRNGQVIKTFNKGFSYKVQQVGVYRVVVKRDPFFPLLRDQKWIPWIFSNPIYVRGL